VDPALRFPVQAINWEIRLSFPVAQMLTNLAITYAWVGEKDLALKQLEEIVRIPSLVSYGRLRLHPFWDPLRGDPRFEKIVNSLALN